MSARVAAWLAWSLWTVTMAGYAFMLLLAFLKPSLVGDDPVVIFVPFTSFVLAFATVGALVASRRPGNPVGWILCASALAYAVGGFTGNYAHYTFNIEPGALPAGALVAWV